MEGPATIALKRLEAEHLVRAHALSTAVNWRHRLEDWSLLLRLGRGITAFAGDELVGTIMWWPFDERFATIGMVIVAPAMQGRGLGRRLVEAALDEIGARTAQLNATSEGLALYEKLGFRPVGAVHQHQGEHAMAASGALPDGSRLRAFGDGDLPAIVALDEAAAGIPRAGMIGALAEVGEGLVLEQDGRIAGWAFSRRFGRGIVIGPAGARDDLSAKALIAAWIARRKGGFLRVDVPAASGLSSWLERQGLPQVDALVTMVRGPAPPAGTGAARLYALASHGLG